MIPHCFKIVWNRRKANALILTEILVSFLVLCVVFTVTVYYAANWRHPLGFDYRNVWTINVEIPDRNETDSGADDRNLAASRDVLAALRSHREVESAAPGYNTPYSGSTSRRGLYLADRKLVQFMFSRTLPESREILKLNLTKGRWLEPGDESLDYTPVVITENLARRLFGRDDPLNRLIEEFTENGESKPAGKPWQSMRVVGLLSDYRKSGELSDSDFAAFAPQNMNDPERGQIPSLYIIRLNPGTAAAFEEDLLSSLRAVAPIWSFEVRAVESQRRDYLKAHIIPLLIGSTLAGFLIFMVGMGLVGVLWQNVTRRTQEIGLRRALGATAEQVRNQIIGEIVMLTTLALALGTVLFLQVPLLGLMSFVDFGIFLTAIVAAILVLYPFVILCGLYPGWLATRVQPSHALQYE